MSHPSSAPQLLSNVRLPEDDHPLLFEGRILPTPQALSTVERYDGQADALAWLQSVSIIASLFGWNDNISVTIVKL
jgi:hypothetical protein